MTKQEYIDLINDFGTCFSTDAGQHVLEYLKEEIFNNLSFDHTNPNCCRTAWAEGQRYAIAEILYKVKQSQNKDLINQLFSSDDDETPYL